MKITVNPLFEAAKFLNLVREKKDGEGGGNQQHQEQKKEEKDQPKFEVTDEKVAQAVESFRTDAHMKANGLDASAEGTGPGLRVTLRDGNGTILKQLTGEEFLKLREAARKDIPRGKILDQKL